MELYIEKDFIDDLYLGLDFKNLKPAEQVVLNIFKSYGNIDCFMDVKNNTKEELDAFEISNPLIAYLFNSKGPVSVQNIKDHFFNHSKCEQTLIFMLQEEDWFEEAEKKGALCFSLKNYAEKVEAIINLCHIRIDLTQPIKNWSPLNAINTLPLNEIIISDNYILTDKQNQKIDDNIIPLLKAIINETSLEIKASIFTSDLNPIRNEPEKIKEKARKACNKLNRVLSDYNIKYKVISSTGFGINISLHDRIILTNFITIDCGKGFNIFPWMTNTSQIVVDSIFDKYTYNRLKNLKNCFQEYRTHLTGIETNNFKYYPE